MSENKWCTKCTSECCIHTVESLQAKLTKETSKVLSLLDAIEQKDEAFVLVQSEAKSLQEREARLVEVLDKAFKMFRELQINTFNFGGRQIDGKWFKFESIDAINQFLWKEKLSQSDPDWLARRDARMKAEGFLLAVPFMRDVIGFDFQSEEVETMEAEATRLSPDGGKQ